MAGLRRLINTLSRTKHAREVQAELEAHVEMRTADNVAAGMNPEKARREALLRFGNPTNVRESVASVDTWVFLESVMRDLQYAGRQLRKSPAFALTAIVTLMLGIGANVVVFGVLNAIVLKPIVADKAGAIYQIVHKEHGYDAQSYPDFLDLKTRNRTFSGVAAYRIWPAGLSTGSAAYKTWHEQVSTNYFDVLGVEPLLGRFFHDNEEHGPNSVPYIVLSEAFWRAHFNADPAAVGKKVEIDGSPFTIIGVAPASFHGTDVFIWPDFWMPVIDEQLLGEKLIDNRFSHNLRVIGRVQPGITPTQATADLNVVARQMEKENPQADTGMSARLVKPGMLGDSFGEPVRSFLSAVMILAILVLLAACTNLASLFSARAADRGRELAIRLAIGSSHWRLVRQLLTESVLIGMIGGTAGVACSALLLRALSRWQPFADMPIHVTVDPDVRVYAVGLVLALGSGVLSGLLPVRQMWSNDAAQVMKNGPAGTLHFRRLALRDVLLGAQIVLCSLLVTASLVAVRGMQRSLHAQLGFDPNGGILAETDLHMAGVTGKQVAQTQKRLLEEAANIPGVTVVGLINDRPLAASGSDTPVFRESTADFRTPNAAFDAKFFSISPGYFAAAGTHLLLGRDFTAHDDSNTPNVAIVNQTFAERLFGTTAALGKHFRTGPKDEYEVVGIVENGKYDSLTESAWPAMFFSFAQAPTSDTTVVFRTRVPSAQIVPLINRTLAHVDPNLPFTIEPWREGMGLVLFPARIATAVLGAMGVLAAMLALTGIFGMAMYSVSRRLKEFGIRAALGAQRRQLMQSALRRPAYLLVGGTLVGLLCGIAASRLLALIVYQATPRDPLVMLGVVAAMTLIGLLATSIPARHALRVDPSRLLHEE